MTGDLARKIAARLAAVVLERRNSERRMSFEQHHDATTGLPNRRRFVDLLEGELMAAAREHADTSRSPRWTSTASVR